MRKQPLHPYTAIINKKQQLQAKQARELALNWLTKTFPQAFDTTSHVRPLKIGIMQDIMEHADRAERDGLSKTKLREAVVIFTRRIEYLVCLKAREMRVDLEGNPTTTVTEEEAEKAAIKLKQRIAKSMRCAKKTETPNTTEKPLDNEVFQSKPEPLTSYNGQASTTVKAPQTVIIKRKTTRQFDPDSVARLKAKLGLSSGSK